MSRRRLKPYNRVITKPIWIKDRLWSAEMAGIDAGKLPRNAGKAWMEIARQAQEIDRQNFWAGYRDWVDRIAALIEHFEVDTSRPGWTRDLALSLARRHEPEFFSGERIRYSEILAKYGINTTIDDPDLHLAFELAGTHVVKWEAPPRLKSQFETGDLTCLAMAIAAVSNHVKATRGDRKARRVSLILTDDAQLRSLIPAPAATRIRRLLATQGRQGRHRRGEVGTISRLTLEKKLIPELWDAGRACAVGHPTKLQMQFVREVLPTLEQSDD